jgi:hypothetical protein
MGRQTLVVLGHPWSRLIACGDSLKAVPAAR